MVRNKLLSFIHADFKYPVNVTVLFRILSISFRFFRILFESLGFWLFFFRIFSNSFYAVRILWDSFRFYRGFSYPLGIWANSHLFFSDSERFFRILSHSLELLWILPNLLDSLDFFRFFPIFFPIRLEFDWILLYSFGYFLIWIFSDYLLFFQNLCLFFGFFRILFYPIGI